MLLVENVLHEFLNDFLNKRNLPFPDGRMLYAYQMNQREYLELKEKLIGRGTRVNEEYQKYYFTIMDFRKATKLFADPEFDGYKTDKNLNHDEI